MGNATDRGHETRDASVRAIVWFAGGLVIGVLVISFALVGVYRVFERWHPSPESSSHIVLHPQPVAPPPRLQTNPIVDLAQYQSAQRAKLNSYGWVDRAGGTIHIPIERAMDLIAQRGLPTRGLGTQNASGVTAVQMRAQKATQP